jgi:hypothetical protein
MSVKRTARGTFAKGSAGGPGRLPKEITAATREAQRLAGEVSHLCQEIRFVRYRLVELEATARGTAAKIHALIEGNRGRIPE